MAVSTTGVRNYVTPVGIAKDCDTEAPAATITVAGGAAPAGLRDMRVTIAPPAGAGPSSLTVALRGLAPEMTVVETVKRERVLGVTGATGLTVMVVDFVEPP